LYYDLRLSLGCNLGKDLSREVRMSQLVKHKDIEQYVLLYIPIDNKVKAWWIYVNDIREYEETIPTIWGTDWY